MTIVSLIIQARAGSKRLPNKMLMRLAGKPMIYRIIERVSRCKNIDNIILAIPKSKENLKFTKINFKKKIKIFRGSENNLVKRYYDAAKKFRTDIVVRLPGDNCMPEPTEIDKIISFYKKYKKPFFASNLANVHNNGYPDGIGAEVFGFSFLEDLSKKRLTSKEKEHLHLNFYDYKTDKAKNSKWCKVRTIQCPKRFQRPDICLDVNTFKDYIFVKKIYENLYFKKKKFNILDVIKFIDNEKKK